MSVAAIVASIDSHRQKQLFDYFVEKGAVTPESAIELDLNEFNSNSRYMVSSKEINRYNFIKKDSWSKKYYADVKVYQRDQKLQSLFTIFLFLGFLVIIGWFIYQIVNLGIL